MFKEDVRPERYESKSHLLSECVGAYSSRYVGGTSRAGSVVGALSGKGDDAKPCGFKDYHDVCERSFYNFLFEERVCSGRTVRDHSHDICSCSADDREGDGLFIGCAGGTAAGCGGGGRASRQRCCKCC